MSIFPTTSSPFGLLEPIHTYILSNTEQLSWSNWWKLFVIPFIPLYLQVLLLRREHTRKERVALAVLGLGLLWHAGLRYRFLQPWFNAFNNGLGIGYMTISLRYLEFAFIEGRLVDEYWESRGRHWSVAAFDICINARWLGLGPEGLKQTGSSPKVNYSVDSYSPNNSHSPSNGRIVANGGAIKRQSQTYPAWVVKPPLRLSRSQAVLRHFIIFFRNYTICDTMLSLLRAYGSDTIGSSTPVPHALYQFSHKNAFIVFPKVAGGFIAPRWLADLAAVICVAVCVWLALSMAYHFLAAIAVGTGLYEAEAWEVDLFDDPLAADSLLDFWGRRWHQFFRHQFLMLSTFILRALGLPVSSPSILFLSFFFSGTMHTLGQYLMDPVPALLPVFALFLLSGFGCALEVMFKRITGRKVKGFWGRVWTWAWMLTTGRWAANAWFESGVGGSYLCPAYIGEWLSPWVQEWIVDRKAC